jgi:ABC-type polysaccharide/polyol phosphate transport system ATPase subunit
LSEACIRAEGLSKRFLVVEGRKTLLRTVRALAAGKPLRRERWILQDLTFTVARGEKLALVGRNGAGKTTLLRVLAGIYPKTSGTLVVTATPAALLNCSTGFHGDLPIIDNLYLFGALHGVGRDVLGPRRQAILEVAGLEHLAYAPLKELSTGQVRRLALTVFSHTPGDLLILDEVLANLDRGFLRESELFFEAMVRSDKTMIMTSHDSSVLRKYCERAMWLDNGRVLRLGPCEEVIDAYERALDPGAASDERAVARSSSTPVRHDAVVARP